MLKEIGGYFGLDEFVKNHYYNDLINLNTGRNALLYLIKAKGIKKIYLPYYLCDSVTKILKQNNCDFEFYHIKRNFFPYFDRILKDNEFIYIVNYYGQLSKTNVINLKERYKNIILDNTHAFYQKPIRGIDTLYSCRKFFGVPDGAYLSTDTILNENLERDQSFERMEHILGRFERSASEYYIKFKENDLLFSNEPLKFMSKLTYNLLGAIDYRFVRERRISNYNFLARKLEKYNRLHLKFPYTPFAYPLYLENGNEVRKKLAKRKIYIPTLWPNVLTVTETDSREYDYTTNILPLPCDQRYNLRDMEYLMDNLRECIHV